MKWPAPTPGSKLARFTQGAIAGAKRGAWYLTIIIAALWAVMIIVYTMMGMPYLLTLVGAALGICISGVLQGAFLGAIIGGVRALNESENERGDITVRSWFMIGSVLGIIMGLVLGIIFSLLVLRGNQTLQIIFTTVATGGIVGGSGGALIGVIRRKAL